MMTSTTLRKRINLLVGFFISALAIAGISAIPLRSEINLLNQFLGKGTWLEQFWPALAAWISFVHQGLITSFDRYPFIQYGTDWLAFAHIAIAVAFLGVLKDPVRNIWVVEFGMIACILLIPAAILFGALRGIPPFWTILDCSFGVFGILPLWLCRSYIIRLESAVRG